MLPDVPGKDVVELGCGTAYWGAWLKRAGAQRVVGVDVTPAQLETARQMNEQHGLGLELVEANAEETGLPGESFDLAFSEYGASIWCDPAKWIPEAARLLRDGGELVFMRGSTLQLLCMPDEGQVGRAARSPPEGPVQARVVRRRPRGRVPPADVGDAANPVGQRLRAASTSASCSRRDDAPDHEYYDTVPAEWAKRWPDEEIWRLRLRRR